MHVSKKLALQIQVINLSSYGQPAATECFLLNMKDTDDNLKISGDRQAESGTIRDRNSAGNNRPTVAGKDQAEATAKRAFSHHNQPLPRGGQRVADVARNTEYQPVRRSNEKQSYGYSIRSSNSKSPAFLPTGRGRNYRRNASGLRSQPDQRRPSIGHCQGARRSSTRNHEIGHQGRHDHRSARVRISSGDGRSDRYQNRHSQQTRRSDLSRLPGRYVAAVGARRSQQPNRADGRSGRLLALYHRLAVYVRIPAAGLGQLLAQQARADLGQYRAGPRSTGHRLPQQVRVAALRRAENKALPTTRRRVAAFEVRPAASGNDQAGGIAAEAGGRAVPPQLETIHRTKTADHGSRRRQAEGVCGSEARWLSADAFQGHGGDELRLARQRELAGVGDPWAQWMRSQPVQRDGEALHQASKENQTRGAQTAATQIVRACVVAGVGATGIV